MTENDRLLKNTNSSVRNLRVSFLQGPSIGKKWRIYFFVYFGTHNNKIQKIYKQTSVFVLSLSMLLFWFY
jgi:hypothetical protein